MKNLKKLHHWLLASYHNDFHPHLLAKRGLMILFALILGTEGFLVSNVVSSQPGTPPLATAGAANAAAAVLPPGVSNLTQFWLAYVILPLFQVAAYPQTGRIAFYTLLVVMAILMGSLAHTLSMRRVRYREVGYISGGIMLALAATFVLYDTHVLLPAIAYQESVSRSEILSQAQPRTLEANASTFSSVPQNTGER